MWAALTAADSAANTGPQAQSARANQQASKSLRWELSLVLVARIQGGVPPFNKVLCFDPEVVVTQR